MTEVLDVLWKASVALLALGMLGALIIFCGLVAAEVRRRNSDGWPR